MSKNKLMASVAVLVLGLAGTAHADLLIGKVVDIDQRGKSIILNSDVANVSRIKSYEIVWDESLAEIQHLKKVQMGETLAVEAGQDPVSRKWIVNAVGGPQAAAEREALRTQVDLK